MSAFFTSPLFNPYSVGFSPLISPKSNRYTRRHVTLAAAFCARNGGTVSTRKMSQATGAQVFRCLMMIFSLVSLLVNIFPNLINRAQPNPVSRLFQIVAQELDGVRISGLECTLADVMADKNDPSPLLNGVIHPLFHLRKIHAVEGGPHGLRQINDRRIVGGFREIATAHEEAFSNQWHVALYIKPSTHKCLAAWIGEGF